MDQLQFDPANTANTDTSIETEGYENQVEEIQQAYPEQDWRTPAQIEEENQAQVEGQPTAEAPVEETPVTPTEVVEEEPWTPKEAKPLPEIGPNNFAEYVDPTTGKIPIDVLRAAGVDENIIIDYNMEDDFIDEERQLWSEFDANGQHGNKLNVYNTVMKIRASQALTDRYDRNGDGVFTYADWHDISPNIIQRAFGVEDDPTPEWDARKTQEWLADLQDGDPTKIDRIAVISGEPMARFVYQKRKGILGATSFEREGLGGRISNVFGIGGEQKGELQRQTWSAGMQSTLNFVLGSFEKTAAGLHAGITDEEEEVWNDPLSWFDTEAFENHDAKFDDIVIGHKNRSSKAYAFSRPVDRVWSDPIMFDIGRYTPVIVASMFAPNSWHYIGRAGLTGAGTKSLGWVLPNVAKAVGITWATETIPTNIFADTNTFAMQTFKGTNPQVRKLMEAHPELNISGTQMMHGIESGTSRKMELLRGEMVAESGGLLIGNTLFKGAFKSISRLGGKISGKGVNQTDTIISKLLDEGKISKPNFEQLSTSTKAKPKIQTDGDIWATRNQVLGDELEAAQSQALKGSEGPSSVWNDPWSTPAELDSTYGAFKNGRRMSGQGGADIRKGIADVWDQADEMSGQIGIEGGTLDGLYTPVQKARFAKEGIPDPWVSKAADDYWQAPNIQRQINNLPLNARTLGNLAESSLENIKNLINRNNGSFSIKEFWGKNLVDFKLKAGAKLTDGQKFVTKNLQVADAINQSLFTRLRDLSDAAGEQLGKGDLFATDGPIRKISDNLVMGLANAKKTRFTWELAQKRLADLGEESLTPKMIKEIEDIVAKKGSEFHQEAHDGVRFMMQVLENSDSDELAEGLLDVWKASPNIHNWTDFDKWMRQKIRGGEFNGKVKTGVLIKELQGVMINSILSGPKTPMRALLGTTVNSYLNAINEVAGATLRRPFTGDIASQKASLAKLKGMFELIPEATQVFRKTFKSKWNADIADIRTRYSEPMTRGDENWHLFGEWTERNGTVGDKAAFYMANIARTLNNNKLLSWSPRALASIDDTFKWLLARARSKEIGMRQALEVAGRDHVDFSTDLMKQAEDIHFKNLLDADGNIDVGLDSYLNKQFKEVTLTSELTGFSKELDTLLKDKPLVRPFYLFARTGINGLNFTYKNTPLLGALHKESIDILRHTGDDFTPLFKYGIENANDLANARNLFAGRQAVGAATVTTFAGMYMAGQLTGNGPADRQLRQNWINAGWKPNHLYIGDFGFDYSSLEPYNTIFASIADIGDNMELMGSEWAEKRLQAAAFVIGRGVTSKTYMSGLDQMLQIAQMKPGAFNKGAANILNNSIPLAGLRNEFGKWVNPHMKELNSDMWTNIRNRNQASEFLAGGDKLPEKSDILNGQPIKDWNIIHRSFNAVSPVGFDVRKSSPGRRLLLDSNYDLKSTTYAYGGYSFVKDAHVRAHFQNAIGTVPVTVGFKKFKNVEEALNYLAKRPDIKNSLKDMQRDAKNPANWDLDPNTYPHNTLIDQVMNQARAKAWAKINQKSHPGYERVMKLKSEKDGKDSKTRDNRQEILDLSFPDRTVDQFPKN